MEEQQPQLPKQERGELRHQEKERGRSRTMRRKTTRKIFIWVLVILGIGGGIFGIMKLNSQSSYDQAQFDVTTECVTHGNLGMHIHPLLSIFIDGEKQDISANIGIVSSTCFRPIHTHDASGKLHIEWRTLRDFTLGEFFKVWDRSFSKGQIFDYKVDKTHTLTITVNGIPSEKYEDLILKDGNRIEIHYE